MVHIRLLQNPYRHSSFVIIVTFHQTFFNLCSWNSVVKYPKNQLTNDKEIPDQLNGCQWPSEDSARQSSSASNLMHRLSWKIRDVSGKRIDITRMGRGSKAPTNELTTWSRVLLEKLTVAKVVKKYPAFYGSWRFITVFTRASLIRGPVLTFSNKLVFLPWVFFSPSPNLQAAGSPLVRLQRLVN
jgi:hypothetical protein